MKVLKKFGILFVSLFFIVAIIIIALFSKRSIDKLKAAVAERDEQIVTLEDSINEIGPMTHGYVLNTDVRAGEMIDESYLDEVTVPEKLVLGLITDASELENCYFRTSLKTGTVLSTEDVNYDYIEDSLRYYDVILDSLPVGIKVGDYIDIRITFPYGEDFIGLTGKKVYEINSGVLKLRMDENDIIVYNSMMLDKVMYSGTNVYAATYVDPGSQDIAEAFYPINTKQSELLAENPNALELVKQEMLLKRQLVEAKLGANGVTNVDGLSEEDIQNKLAVIDSQISNIRSSNQSRLDSANSVVQARYEQEAEEARLQAEQEAAGE